MKVLYISSACAREHVEEVNKTSKIRLEYSIINFHNSIINGLKKNNVQIESLIGLPISIGTNKKIFWPKKSDIINGINYIYSSFINIPILKQLTMLASIKKQFKKWLKLNCNEDKYVIIDASFVSILPSIYKIAQKNSVKIVGIFADIYDYMCDVDKPTNKLELLKKYFRKKLKNIYPNMDGYVFLTEEMNKLINCNKKDYVIMEGIYENKFSKEIVDVQAENKVDFIMYAGRFRREIWN